MQNIFCRRTWKSGTYEMFWAFLVLWSMLIQELHDATRETLSNFSRTILKSPLSAKTLLHCLRVFARRRYYLSHSNRTPASASICYLCKTMHIIAFLCCTQIIYNTSTYLWTAYNVRIPIITVIITDFWCVRKSCPVTLCMYFYHFITTGASGENV